MKNVGKFLYPSVFVLACVTLATMVSVHAQDQDSLVSDIFAAEYDQSVQTLPVQEILDIVQETSVDVVNVVNDVVVDPALDTDVLSDAVTDIVNDEPAVNPSEVEQLFGDASHDQVIVTATQEAVVDLVSDCAVFTDTVVELACDVDVNNDGVVDASGAVASDNQEVSVPSYDEQDVKSQWDYVKLTMEKQDAQLSGFLNTCGSAMNEHASLITIPAAVIGAAAGYCGAAAYADDIIKVAAGDARAAKSQRAFVGSCALVTMSVAVFVVYAICKRLGPWLHDRSALCLQILTKYAAEWSEHKPNTPAILHPIFEVLHADLSAHGKLTSISQQQACQIVEGALVGAMMLPIS